MKLDFDFGNLVYILLMLVFVIFGATKKKKKPILPSSPLISDDDPASEESPAGDLSSNLKKIFGEYLGVEELVENQQEQGGSYRREATDRYNEESLLDTDYSDIDKIEKKEGVSTIFKMSEHVQDIQHSAIEGMEIDLEKYPSFTRDVLDEFDPRVAVLFSEVFKPKYF